MRCSTSFVIMVTCALLGCTSAPDQTGSCRDDSDCKAERVCEDGACIEPGPGTSDDGPSPSGTSCTTHAFADKCEIACRDDSGACVDMAEQCRADCLTTLDGFYDLCAQCIVDHTNLFACDGYDIGKPTSDACASFCDDSTTALCSSSSLQTKCEAACRDGGGCPEKAALCSADCLATVEGLPFLCAQCVVDYTNLFGCDGYDVGKPTSDDCGPFCSG